MLAPNANQKLAFDDSRCGLEERGRNALNNSWTKIFRDVIFPRIGEEPFSVLCSDACSAPTLLPAS